jgi:hypothetical protein
MHSSAVLVLTTTCTEYALSWGGELVVAVSVSLVLLSSCTGGALSFGEGDVVMLFVGADTS